MPPKMMRPISPPTTMTHSLILSSGELITPSMLRGSGSLLISKIQDVYAASRRAREARQKVCLHGIPAFVRVGKLITLKLSRYSSTYVVYGSLGKASNRSYASKRTPDCPSPTLFCIMGSPCLWTTFGPTYDTSTKHPSQPSSPTKIPSSSKTIRTRKPSRTVYLLKWALETPCWTTCRLNLSSLPCML